MYSIKLEWKHFNVDLASIEVWMKSSADHYTGNSADTALTLWFSEEPDDDTKALIKEYWEELTEESEEASYYLPQENVAAKISELKSGLISKSWDAMTTAERKLVLGQTPTREELGL